MAAPRAGAVPWLFALLVFVSAALVFTVEPMMARLVLPVLGGSAAVWNISLVFFQTALLGGYLYAHGLQRLSSLRAQILVHVAVLAVAALSLPLALSPLMGDPAGSRPTLWLMAMLTLSVGAPFFALSATAPLIQAWRARAFPEEASGEPWGLYGASNVGSLVGLLAYPTVVEPWMGLALQRNAWSLAYVGFLALVVVTGATLWRRVSRTAPTESATTSASWLDRARWMALAAIPSSLLLGVTSYVATDVGSAPFLWVAPLALYLLTFVLAFRSGSGAGRGVALALQAVTIILACALARPLPAAFLFGASVHFSNFFFTALVCHMALVARRPDTARLTEFYLCLSIGGVLGGAVNALIAPAIFNSNIEYPAVLAMSCLARSWGPRPRFLSWPSAIVGLCALAVVAAIVVLRPPAPLSSVVLALPLTVRRMGAVSLLLFGGAAAFGVRNRAPWFALCAVLLLWGGANVFSRSDVLHQWRGFYGILKETRGWEPRLGGAVRRLTNGSTLHGAEAVSPTYRCQPLLYYAHETPIGQVMDVEAGLKPRLDVGVVGLGAGSLAAYNRSSDHFTFFEIDPLVIRIATDPRNFSYLGACSKGRPNFVVGDARLSLSHRHGGLFDVLVIDAFSSDSVPAHLLTVEAVRLYLSLLKPGGVVILHLSNRNLDLIDPAQAVAVAAGGLARLQRHHAAPDLPAMWESSEDAVLIAREPAGLAPFAADSRWRAASSHGVAPWTDDHVDLFGALVRHLSGRDGAS